MEVSEGQCQAATDKQGRAFFGDVGLVEGSGRVQQDENLPDGGAVRGLECLLVAAAGSGRGRSGCDGVCLCVWSSSQVQPVVEVMSTLTTLLLAASGLGLGSNVSLAWWTACQGHQYKAGGLQQATSEARSHAASSLPGQVDWPLLQATHE